MLRNEKGDALFFLTPSFHKNDWKHAEVQEEENSHMAGVADGERRPINALHRPCRPCQHVYRF